MNKVIRFLKKAYYWRKLAKLDISASIFVLTGDIDSTVLSDEKMGLQRTNLKIAKEHGVPFWIFVTPDPVWGLKRLYDKIRKWGEEIIMGCHGKYLLQLKEGRIL